MLVKIYTLQSTRNLSDIRYVGKTIQKLNSRLSQHLSLARNKAKRHVYNWIRKELSEGYEISIIEIDSVETNIESIWQSLEQKWIAKYKELGYNLTNETKGGEGSNDPEIIAKRNKSIIGNHRSEETKQKISESNKHPKTEEHRQKVKQSMIDLFGYKVDQYTIEGDFIQSWDSISLASEFYNICNSAIAGCCKHDYGFKTAGGFVWRYSGEEYHYDDSKHIIQLNKDYEFINEFKSLNEACELIFGEITDKHKLGITQCRGFHIKSYKGFVFLNKKDYINNNFIKYKLIKNQRILQKDLNGNLIQIFKNSKDAEKQTGFGHKYILETCRGKRPNYKNYIWEFE